MYIHHTSAPTKKINILITTLDLLENLQLLSLHLRLVLLGTRPAQQLVVLPLAWTHLARGELPPPAAVLLVAHEGAV